MKILSAQISPSVKIASQQENIFQQPSVVDCDYMLAMAIPYALGSDVTRFEVQFGILNKNQQELDVFQMKTMINLELTKEELASWGENDEACLNIIAKKLGTTIVSTKLIEV